jgi:hypothetical protein
MVIAGFIDMKMSEGDLYYGLTEANPLYKNEYGFYDKLPSLLITGGIIFPAVSLLMFFDAVKDWAWIVYLIVIVGEALIIQRKMKNREFSRWRQISIWDDVSRNPWEYKEVPRLTVTTTKGRTWLAKFPWIYVQESPYDTTSNIGITLILQNKLIEATKQFSSFGEYIEHVKSMKV